MASKYCKLCGTKLVTVYVLGDVAEVCPNQEQHLVEQRALEAKSRPVSKDPYH